MRQNLLSLTALAMTLLLVGCEGNTSRVPPIEVFPDMDRQGKGKPQSSSTIFADHRASRMPVPGTVARGYLKEDDVYYTGVNANMYVGKNPEPITPELLHRGQMKFNTYCSPCHDRTGSGQGTVALKAGPLWQPTNLHQDRVKAMNDGEIFTIITQGRRTMPSYRYQILEKDRWAIISYVRALQRTTSASVNDVPAELRSGLK